MRITMPTLLVLRALLDDPNTAKYGLEIIQATGRNPGTVYPLLERLERAGWVTSYREPKVPGRRPRRYHQLTPIGRVRAENVLARARVQLAD